MGTFAIDALAFDLDGVLIDSEAINVRSAFEAFRAFGHELDPGDANRIVGLHPVDYVPLLAERFAMSPASQEELRDHQNRIYHRMWSEGARPIPGAGDVVRGLRDAGRRLALATSAGRDHARHCLEQLDIEDAFEFVLTKDDVARRKPDPEVYLACASRFDVDPGRMLVVEDSAVGVEAALGAGARCVAVRTTYTRARTLNRAHAAVDSLGEIPDLLG